MTIGKYHYTEAQLLEASKRAVELINTKGSDSVQVREFGNLCAQLIASIDLFAKPSRDMANLKEAIAALPHQFEPQLKAMEAQYEHADRPQLPGPR